MYDVWKNVLAEIECNVSAGVFSTFFGKAVELVKIEDSGVAIIGVPNVFIQKQVSTKYNSMIIRALRNNNVEVTKLDCRVMSSNKSRVKKVAREVTENEKNIATQVAKIGRGSQIMKDTGNLNPRYTMDNFVVGSNNDLAASVAKAVIDNPGTSRYNPFFLYGGPGLGKTHLVQAIGNAILANNPEMKILYTPISHFYTDFIQAIRNGKGEEFAQKFLKLDVLIIDDMQFIVNKEKSQEEFFHIFNDLYQQNKQIIITSDRLPNQLKSVDERLASRLSCSGAFDLQMPSFEDKCAILRAKADYDGKEIEQEAIEYIAENVKTNIRDLESEYSQVIAMSDLKGVTPLKLINDGYARITRTSSTRLVSPKQVVDKVAKYYQMDTKELTSKSRLANIKNARQVAMYLLSKELSMSTPKIAAEVGVKDHTTVMHGIKKVTSTLKLDFNLREQLEEIKRSIYG